MRALLDLGRDGGRRRRAPGALRALPCRRAADGLSARRGLSLLALATAVFVADQLTKAWAIGQLSPARPVVVVPGLLNLVLVLNPGVAFGLLAGVPPGWRWLVLLFSLAALGLLCALAIRVVPDGGWGGRIAIGLVLGGAAGNLLDRWRLGAVVDFIDVYWRQWHWPAFNVADSAITVGVALLAVEMVLAPRASGGERADG